MKINIENCVRYADEITRIWLLDELVRNLRELRDRTDADDATAISEFFDVFVFDDDHARREREAIKSSES